MSSALRMQLVVSLLDKLTAPARVAAQSTDKLSKACLYACSKAIGAI